MTRTATPKMKNSEIEFPTMVFQVAYRHQSMAAPKHEAVSEYLSTHTSIQVFIGVKFYDDKKFQVLIARRRDEQGKANKTSSTDCHLSDILPTDKVTSVRMSIPGKSLLWGCDEWKEKEKALPHFMLEVENLRFALRREN